MSVSLSNAFVTLFDAEVKQAYQGKAQLVGAVRARRGVEGSTVKFPKVGRGVATPRIPQTDVTPLNVGFSQVTLTLGDWNAAEYSDIFSQQKSTLTSVKSWCKWLLVQWAVARTK